jgi:hypothetical protein
VAAHALDHHDAVVAHGRGPQRVDGARGLLDARPEAEREVGAVDVVVDRLGDADDVELVVAEEVVADLERVVAADRDEGVELVALPDREARA